MANAVGEGRAEAHSSSAFARLNSVPGRVSRWNYVVVEHPPFFAEGGGCFGVVTAAHVERKHLHVVIEDNICQGA